jgi:hypothetical protein
MFAKDVFSTIFLMQIAAPEPQSFEKTRLQFNGLTKAASEWCVEKSLNLFPVSNSLFNVFKVIGATKPAVWDSSIRLDLCCFIDAVVAHVYHITKESYEYIINQFPILRRQEEEKFGKFLSLDRCLNYFESLKSHIV